jgi:ABC-type branched-subunit amino acid transport system ATPase component
MDLSYGQPRLVVLACAMAVQPSILLLDKPTAGLSSHETAEVDRLLRRLVEEWRIGVLLVEHDVGLVMSVSTTSLSSTSAKSSRRRRPTRRAEIRPS